MKNNIKTEVLQTDNDAGIETTYEPPVLSFFGYKYIPSEQQLLHSFLSNKLVLGAVVVFILCVLCSIFAQWISPVDPIEQTLSARLLPPVWYDGGQSPYLLGTDRLGRDVLRSVVSLLCLLCTPLQTI